jgi:putative transposase
MILVEKHIINKNHKFFNECDELTFLSKNLYNQSLYNIRQYYFENKSYLNYNDNYHITKNQDSYDKLPTKVSCQTIKMVDQNFKSFFSLLKNKNAKNKIPSYLKKDGRYLTKFPKQSLSIKEFKKTGKIKLSKTNINITTKVKDFKTIKEVRIVPRNDFYVIEIVYEKGRKKLKKQM